MSAEKTTTKKDKAQSKGPGPMGSGMSGMMKNCFAGAGAFSECLTLMKGMMNRTGTGRVAHQKQRAGPKGEKNERTDQ